MSGQETSQGASVKSEQGSVTTTTTTTSGWTCEKGGHTSNQCWWSGPVYQLDATDSRWKVTHSHHKTVVRCQECGHLD
eukprot:5109814-Amphidinium_carterae.2